MAGVVQTRACCRLVRDASRWFPGLRSRAAYHHEHSKARSTNLHKYVGQALEEGNVASDHRCNGDCWVEVAA